MKTWVTIAALATLSATWSGPTMAQYYGPEPAPLRGVMPPHEVMTVVRSMGFVPVGHPILRGRAYAVRAIDEDDLAVRVVLDAYTGRVITVREDVATWPGSRFGALGMSAFRYGDYEPIPPAPIPHVRRPPQRSAATTPVPRERPGNASGPSTTGSIKTGSSAAPAAGSSAPPSASSAAVPTPGHSVPAPAAKPAPAASATADAAKATPLVPVAPLD